MNQALLFTERQAAPERGVDKPEDCRVCADAEGEGEDGDGGEARVFAEDSEAIANIRDKAFNGWPAPDFAAVLFHQSEIAEFAACGVRGFFPRHAACDEVFDFFFEVF